MIALRAKRHFFAFSVALGGFDLGDLCEKPLPCRPRTDTALYTRLTRSVIRQGLRHTGVD